MHTVVWMNLKIIVLSGKSQTKKNTHYIISLISKSRKFRLICIDRKYQWFPVVEVDSRKVLQRGTRKFGPNGYVPYLYCDGDFTGVNTGQSLSITSFQYVQFIVCQLCLSKAVLKTYMSFTLLGTTSSLSSEHLTPSLERFLGHHFSSPPSPLYLGPHCAPVPLG